MLPLRGVSAVFMYFSSAITVTFSDAVYLYFPKDMQVIFTVPGVFAVKIPLDEITAILGSDILYIVVFPLSSGFSCSLLLTFIFAEDALYPLKFVRAFLLYAYTVQ